MIAAMERRNWYLLTNSLVAAWFVAAGVAVVVHRFVPHALWLMVHLTLLGAASTAILIWSQHFADTLLRHPGPGGRVALGTRLVAHTVGSVAVVVGIMTELWGLVAAGAAVIGMNAIVHAVLLLRQLRTSLPARFRPLVRYYVASALVFAVGVGLGAWLAAEPGGGLHERILVAHATLNLLGWIAITVIGTAILLWPTVLHAKVRDETDAGARRALPILLFGLVVVVLACIVGAQVLVAVGVAIWIVGLGFVLGQGVRQAREMPPGSYAGWSIAAGMVWLLVCAAMYAGAAVLAPDWLALLDSFAWLVGPFVAGFVVQLLLGALSYLLPVVTIGSPKSAKLAAEELDRGAAFRIVSINGGILLYLLPVPSLVKVLLSLYVFGVFVSFLVLAVRAIVIARRSRRAEGEHPDRSRTVMLGAAPAKAPEPRTSRSGMVVSAVGVLALLVAGGVAADPAAAGIGTAPASEIAATGETTTVTVEVEGMRFVPGMIEVPAGNRLVVEFRNTGTDVHDFTVENGVRSPRLSPGEHATVDVGVVGADLHAWCSVAGHRQMGMELQIIAVGGPDAAGDDGGDGDADGSDATGHSMHGGMHGDGGDGSGGAAASAADDLDLEREPGDGFEARDATLEPAPSATRHELTLKVTEVEREVAPGVTQTLWTFGGTAPGPTLHGKVGDVFEITLVNDGTIGHSIDFHAGMLAPNEPMRTIQPGESLVYTFTATKAGVWMYHCSTMPMSTHIANGMFGAVVIDPPGLAPVDREFILVQSELYLGPQGGEVDAAKVTAERPDLVVFNGYANQYRFEPLEASVGERVRVWVLDAGPNRPSSFHVIGGQFDTVWSEGDYLLRAGGSTGAGGAQALGLMPAQGGFVELEFGEAGDYPFVSHIMVDAERGASGLFHVTDAPQ
ncbi:MAG TPA: multicopper oxidase domain-containing protein [Agromyces sp.]|nr:multicopper oxidase domain-containing protein [Agromyces sp.]